jgi:hypothetical protein
MAAQLARPAAPGTGLEQDGIAQTSPLGTLGEWTGEFDQREFAVKLSKNNELHKLRTWGAAPNPGIFRRHGQKLQSRIVSEQAELRLISQ